MGRQEDQIMTDSDDAQKEVKPSTSMSVEPQIEASTGGNNSTAEHFRTETLKMYYRWLFPFKEMHQWLSYGNDKKVPGSDQGESFFRRREFSFTLENDIYIRFQSFRDAADMEEQVVKKCPHKIDIGAVYSVDPKMKTALQGGDHFAPVERELVFDVDMTDYDDMRTCCTGAAVCERCWTLMTVAIKVVDRILRDDFGFEHLLWVFSGRRGVHCWVCDARARRLSDEQRSAIADYFRVYKGTEGNTRGVSFTGSSLHPSLSRAYERVLLPYFESKILSEQRLLEDEEAWVKFLGKNLPEEGPLSELKQRMLDKWRSDRRGSGPEAALARWKELEATIVAAKKGNTERWRVLEIVFAYTYPRLDLEVSKHMNHLLKAPFCVHPKTGKVCVPIDPTKSEDFSPNSVPTLVQLMEEMNDTGADGEKGAAEGTSLQKHVELFRSLFLTNMARACKAELSAKHKEKINAQRSEGGMRW